MKRFWLVMLSLGLVLAFSASAMAVDVKFSGSYYAAGLYQDKTTFRNLADGSDNVSAAFYYQRLRVQTDFIVSPGLSLITRFDALERIWGGQRSADVGETQKNMGTTTSRYESENIAFDWAYINYVSPIGLFQIGYQSAGSWGTVFGDSAVNAAPAAKIQYTLPIGSFYLNASVQKVQDNSRSAVTDTFYTDEDFDKYTVTGTYVINKDIMTGVALQYQRIALAKATYFQPDPYTFPWRGIGNAYGINPYVKAKIGPVKIEAEATYAWGKIAWEGDEPGWGYGPHPADIKIENITAYLNAVADLGMVYVGGTFAYVSGDDPGTSDKKEGGFVDGGKDFNPTLILFNFERNYWVGAIPGYSPTSNSSPMTNAWFFQGNVGVRPIAPLDINASLSFANADKKPTGVINNAYGWELDVTGTYKITNNLSYMLGGAYLWTGGYFRGTGDSNPTRNNFLLINKLTLTF